MVRKRLGRSQRVVRRRDSQSFWFLVSTVSLGAAAAILVVGFASSSAPLRVPDAFTQGTQKATGRNLTVGSVELVLVLVWLIYCVRRLTLARLAYGPGPVEIDEFTDNRAEPTAPGSYPVTQIMDQLRDKLGRVELHPPMPTDESSSRFLQQLRSTGGDKTDLVATVASFLMLLRPNHAYHVTGSIQERGADGLAERGLSVRITLLPGGSTVTSTYWGASWDRVVERAVHGIAAFVVPRSRAARKPPWRSWRGLPIASDHFDRYKTAESLIRARRYDEALECYGSMLRDDPLNISLRQTVARMYESLGLFLDALAAWADIVEQNPGPPAKRLWREPWAIARHVRALHALTRSDPYEALYRLSTALTYVSRLSPQWLEQRDVGPERTIERRELRARTRTWLVQRYASALSKQPLLAAHDLEELLTTPEDGPSHRVAPDDPAPVRATLELKAAAQSGPTKDARQRELRLLVDLFFVAASSTEFEALSKQYSGLRQRLSGLNVTKRALRIAKYWANERLKALKSELTAVQASFDPGPRAELTPPETLKADLGRILSRRIWRSSKEWFDHYNATCVYAVALTSRLDLRGALENSVPTTFTADEDRLAAYAIRELETAIACADSSFVGSRRPWVLSGDPDLDTLRTHPSFRRFEAKYYFSYSRTPARPPGVHRYEASRYVKDLVAATAGAMAARWRSLSDGVELPAVEQLQSLWETECAVWRHLHAVAENPRHWPSRVALISAMNTGCEPGRERFLVRYPVLSEMVGNEARDVQAVWQQEERHEHQVRENLRKLAQATQRGDDPSLHLLSANNDAWREYLERSTTLLDHKMEGSAAETLMTQRSALWSSVHYWFLKQDRGRALTPAIKALPLPPPRHGRRL